MPKKTKAHSQRIHAMRRAYERYDLVLERKDLDEIVRKIHTGDCTFIERQSNRISLFYVDVRGKRIPIVYDRNRQNIVTFLPPEFNPGDSFVAPGENIEGS